MASHESQMFGPPEPEPFLRRAYGRSRALRAWLGLMVAMRRSRRTELWIGDSHAMTFNQGIQNAMFLRGPEGQLILRVGARLMWSLGTKGFPPKVWRTGRLVRRLGRTGALLPLFCAGEIDVRAHLAGRTEGEVGFVDAYVRRCAEIAELFKARSFGIVVPPPPIALNDEDLWYPVVGTVEERVRAHGAVRHALAAAVELTQGAFLVDFSDLLADSTGAMPPGRTTDGCHINLDAVALVRERINGGDVLPVG